LADEIDKQNRVIKLKRNFQDTIFINTNLAKRILLSEHWTHPQLPKRNRCFELQHL